MHGPYLSGEKVMVALLLLLQAKPALAHGVPSYTSFFWRDGGESVRVAEHYPADGDSSTNVISYTNGKNYAFLSNYMYANFSSQLFSLKKLNARVAIVQLAYSTGDDGIAYVIVFKDRNVFHFGPIKCSSTNSLQFDSKTLILSGDWVDYDDYKRVVPIRLKLDLKMNRLGKVLKGRSP